MKIKLVIDANILFAALIKKSISPYLIMHDNLKLYAPEFILNEFEKYKKLIKQKTSISDLEFLKLIDLFTRKIKIIPKKEFIQFLPIAKKICPDQNDILYFALALKLKIPIWSNDKKLENQNIIKIYSTRTLLEKTNI